MPLDEQTRRKLILLKEEQRLSNKELGEQINNVSGQIVGRWIVDKNASISDENIEKIQNLVKDVDLGVQGIKNTLELRQLIFKSSMKKGLSYSSIVDKMGKNISPEELELLLSDNGADFTAKTLSLLCAILDIKKDDLPISEEDKDKLFIHAMKADMLLTEIPIYHPNIYDSNEFSLRTEVFFNWSKVDPIEKYLTTNINKNFKHCGIRYYYDNTFLNLEKNDLLIFGPEDPSDNDLCVFRAVGGPLTIGYFKMRTSSIQFENDKSNKIPYHSGDLEFHYLYKVIKVIRDL